MGSKAVKNVRKLARRGQAQIRDEERAKRTPQEQLAKLDLTLGEGKGAVKERARLMQLINQAAKELTKAAKAAVKEAVEAAVEAAEEATAAPKKPKAKNAKPAKKTGVKRTKTS